MKHPNSTDEPPRFSGQIRHYHRGSARPLKTWKEWVDGKSARNGASKNWIRISAVIVATFALAGIISALIAELG